MLTPTLPFQNGGETRDEACVTSAVRRLLQRAPHGQRAQESAHENEGT